MGIGGRTEHGMRGHENTGSFSEGQFAGHYIIRSFPVYASSETVSMYMKQKN